ncbi:adenosylcobinamide-phosphate synthase CbiB [bacterium]|nr:adenosylcobinamide-phosphate synthase CbiB [bacterium]
MPPLLFTLAYTLDWLIGDPAWLPHPVRWMGKVIEAGEKALRKISRSSLLEFSCGLTLTLFVIGLFAGGSWFIILLIKQWNQTIAIIVLPYLAVMTLASRSLLDETLAVSRLLSRGDLISARKQVARIVGRDTENLDEQEIARASIETLAESASDGIIAPMLYLAIGGIPAALAYKAINTLDSMIGHRNQRYEFFGKCAARFDDLTCFIPSRLTGMLIILAAWTLRLNWRGAFKVMWHDGSKHASVNAGYPEAAMAGALGVRLGGTNYYDGEPHQGPFLGVDQNPLDNRALRNGLRLTVCVSSWMFAISLTICILISYL